MNEAEKAKYPEYLALQEVRKMRRDLSDQFDELVRGYNEFQRESGNTGAMLNNFGLVIGASDAFLLGEKISYLLPAENPYVLPAMRAALEQLIRSGYQVDRTQLLLQELRVNPVCTYLEPTEEELEELRKPPEKMIYRIEVGTKFYLGSRSFEVVGMAGDEIRYCDSSFPIMQSTLSYAALTERLAESPLNDDLLIPESSLQSQAPVSSLMSEEPITGSEDAEPSEGAPSIDHFYVAKDITAPDIGITEYPTLEEALAAYRSLPMDTTKALGAQNDKPMPGSLDFIQCVYDSNTGLHRDVLITDYLRLPDWDTQEVDEIVERIELFLDLEQPELPEDILEEAKQRINEFTQKEFELDADFTNPSCVGIAYSSTEDGEHEIQVNVDLPGRAILFYVDNQVVSEVKCSDSDFLAYLGNLDFSELIDFADQEYESQKEEPESHADEMIRQAQLAAQLSEETGQNIFAFEAGNPNPINALQPAAPARPRTTAAPFTLHPEVPTSARHDYRIADDDLGVGTPSERFRNNVAAIRLLKKLEAEDRLATADEQDILAKYVGWGGLSACFEERHSRYQELKALLTDAEYEAARESTLTAFYTPPIVIRAMYQVLANLGFHEGNVLEPSCGIGHFIGSLPDSMSAAKMYGVELDSISGRIAQQLYHAEP